MKYFFTLFILLNILCNKADQPNVDYQPVVDYYKGKLVLKGLCLNYVIQIIEGSVDTALYEKRWVNPSTNTTYENVFRLGSICTFPSNIKEGDEFYFTIPKNPVVRICAQCKAYSPTPDKSINIAIYYK
jgi:hypothetical protein